MLYCILVYIMNKNNTDILKSNIITELEDYMFTSINIDRLNKHMIHVDLKPKSSLKYIPSVSITSIEKTDRTDRTDRIEKIDRKEQIEQNIKIKENKKIENKIPKKIETMYKPRQKDSLFWCFYILKNGFFNYEMEINGQYFVIEKKEKFKYIELIRKNKDLLKLHKIKPLTELEDDLANKDRISIKTFFALCILENINVLLVNKRKVYQLLCKDIDKLNPLNIVHRNTEMYEHSIELEPTEEIIKKYKETYYMMSSFDATLKSMGSYKLDELIDLCKKLNISIEPDNCKNKDGKIKFTKKDIYERLVLNY